jgi:uncharacterized membrane protein
MEEWIKTGTIYLARFVEGAAALVIMYSSIKATIVYFKNMLSSNAGFVPKLEIRLSLGRSLAIALELLLGADILKTAVAPTWNEIGQLAAIAALRTALNYFLERELKGTDVVEKN